jgi:hypothetical protein
MRLSPWKPRHFSGWRVRRRPSRGCDGHLRGAGGRPDHLSAVSDSAGSAKSLPGVPNRGGLRSIRANPTNPSAWISDCDILREVTRLCRNVNAGYYRPTMTVTTTSGGR